MWYCIIAQALVLYPVQILFQSLCYNALKCLFIHLYAEHYSVRVKRYCSVLVWHGVVSAAVIILRYYNAYFYSTLYNVKHAGITKAYARNDETLYYAVNVKVIIKVFIMHYEFLVHKMFS